MIEVNVEVHSIRNIEESARKAFLAGDDDTVCPHRFGSTARRIWMRSFDKCQSLAALSTDKLTGGA